MHFWRDDLGLVNPFYQSDIGRLLRGTTAASVGVVFVKVPFSWLPRARNSVPPLTVPNLFEVSRVSFSEMNESKVGRLDFCPFGDADCGVKSTRLGSMYTKTQASFYRAPTHLVKLLRGRHNDEDMASGGIEEASGGYFGGGRREGFKSPGRKA